MVWQTWSHLILIKEDSPFFFSPRRPVYLNEYVYLSCICMCISVWKCSGEVEVWCGQAEVNKWEQAPLWESETGPFPFSCSEPPCWWQKAWHMHQRTRQINRTIHILHICPQEYLCLFLFLVCLAHSAGFIYWYHLSLHPVISFILSYIVPYVAAGFHSTLLRQYSST